MNKRIRELAKQAGMEDYPTRGVNALYGDDIIEKFVELIVKECADICVGVGEQEDSPYGSIAWDCAEKLKKNFGVN